MMHASAIKNLKFESSLKIERTSLKEAVCKNRPLILFLISWDFKAFI